MEAEHTSFFWPEVDDLLTYEFSADLMDQLHAGLQGGPPADAPPPPAPSFLPAAGAPPMPGPTNMTLPGPDAMHLTLPAPPGPVPSAEPPQRLSGPNPFVQEPIGYQAPPAVDPVAAPPAAVPPVPDLRLSSPVPTDADPTIRTSEIDGGAIPGPTLPPPPDAPMPGSGPGYVPDLVAGSFGSEMAPPPPAAPAPVDIAGGLDGLRGSRLFDPRPEVPDADAGRLRLGNLFEPTDPGAPPQTRRLVRLAGRQSPDEVDVTSARLVSPFDSSGPSVRSLFPASGRDGDRPGRTAFTDGGFGPGAPTSELRMGSPAPFGPDAGPFDGGPRLPPASLSHSTVVDPASGPPVGSSFLAPAPSDAWNSSNPAWTSVSDTVSELPPRQGQGFLYLEEDADPWAGPAVMRQAEPATRDKGAMLDSVVDVLDRKRGALLAGALALTAVLGGLLAYSKLTGGDTDASGAITAATNTTTASSVSPATGESGSGASVSIAGPTTVVGTEAPSSAVTEAGSTSSTRKRATTSSSTATTAAPTDPTTVSTQPPTSPTTQPPTSPSTTRPVTTTTTRPTTTTTRPTTTTTASTTTTTRPTTTTSTTTAPTDPPTTPSTSGSSVTPAIATP